MIKIKIPDKHRLVVEAMSVRCPSCEERSDGIDIVDEVVNYKGDLYHFEFTCPKCEYNFNQIIGYCGIISE